MLGGGKPVLLDKVVKISCITFAGGLDSDFSVTLGMLTSD